MITLTFIFSLYFDLGILINFLGKFSADIAKVWHWYASIVESFLRPLQLIIRELQLANQVSYALCQASPSKKMTTQVELSTTRQRS